jgi:hypothetical protein
MVSTLVVAALLSAPDAGTLPHTLFIYSGGATREAATTEVAAFEKLRPALATVLAPLASGYPKVVESGTIDGLKPGFFVVVLAACDSALEADPASAPFHTAAQLLELYKAVDPKVYARSVRWPEPLACPDGLFAWMQPSTAEIKAGTGLLRISAIRTKKENEWSEPRGVTAAFLRDNHGEVLDSKVEEDGCDVQVLEKKGRGVHLGETCVSSRCTGLGYSQDDTTWTAKDGKLVVDQQEKVLSKAWCD